MNDYSDEINFKPYIHALRKGWWFILLLIIIGAGSTYLYLSSQPPKYSSTATILLTRTRSNLTLSEEFQTFNENVSDSRSRMEALIAIAQSDAVVQDTLRELKDELPAGAKTVDGLKSLVKIGNQGDLILVTANTEKSSLSVDLANNWANNAVKTINLAYGGEQSLNAVEGKLVDAEKEYKDAQTALESFISENHITLIENRVTQGLKILELLQLKETGTIENLSLSQFEGIKLLLNGYYQTISEMDQLISQAQTLKQQLQSGPASPVASAADSLAILLARANAYGLTNNMSLQINLADITALTESPTEYIADLDAIIQQATEKKTAAEENIRQVDQDAFQLDNQAGATSESPSDPVSQEFQKQIYSLAQIDQFGDNTPVENSGNDSLIQQTAYQVQQLNSELEKEKGILQTLTAKRDLSWEAYQALLRKATELENSSGTNNNVSLASRAVLRQRPVTRNTIQAAIIVGILFGILGAILLIIWQLIKHPQTIGKGEDSAKT